MRPTWRWRKCQSIQLVSVFLIWEALPKAPKVPNSTMRTASKIHSVWVLLAPQWCVLVSVWPTSCSKTACLLHLATNQSSTSGSVSKKMPLHSLKVLHLRKKASLIDNMKNVWPVTATIMKIVTKWLALRRAYTAYGSRYKWRLWLCMLWPFYCT